jgi:hypothetical protein
MTAPMVRDGAWIERPLKSTRKTFTCPRFCVVMDNLPAHKRAQIRFERQHQQQQVRAGEVPDAPPSPATQFQQAELAMLSIELRGPDCQWLCLRSVLQRCV